MQYVETRDVPLDELTRFPGNARRGNVDAIRESIRRTGQYRSIVVRDTGGAFVILAGNHTFDAVTAEGHDTIRCEIIHCEDDEARRINLADNRYSELGTTDNDALAELLSYLDGDYEGTGFTEADVERLLTPPAFPAGDDAAPPEEFPSYDDETIQTEHTCPKCGYQWSSKSTTTTAAAGSPDDDA